MSAIYLFRIDGAKDNDKFFNALRPSMSYVYAGTEIKVGSLHKELAHKLSELERKIENHDENIRTLFEAIHQLMTPPPAEPHREIGFHVKETGPPYRVKVKRKQTQT